MINTRKSDVPLRLAVITSRFSQGNAESFLSDEIKELAKHCNLTIYAAVPGLLAWNVLAAAALELARDPRSVMHAFVAILSGPRSLQAKVKNLAVFPKALALARDARRERIEHVHAYWLSAPATVAFVISRLNGLPWSATGHRYDLVDFNITTVGSSNTGILAGASFVRTISERGREAVRAALGTAGSQRVELIHLGFDLPDRASVHPARELQLLCAAALTPVKDHATLFRALKRVKDTGIPVLCTLAGDGPERPPLKALASRLGIERLVRFEGVVPHAELLARLHRGDYDAAILTSTDRGLQLCEGIPACLIEAMAAGVPCIATASGSVGELVASGESGILCPPNDERKIAEAITTLALNVELRQKLGDAARRKIEREFDVTKTVQRLAELLGVSVLTEEVLPA